MNNFTVTLRKGKKGTISFNLCALKMKRKKFEETLFKEAQGYYSKDYTVYVHSHYMLNHLVTISMSENFNSPLIIFDLLDDNKRAVCKMLSQMGKQNSNISISSKVIDADDDIHKQIENDYKDSLDSSIKENVDNLILFDDIDSYVGIDAQTIWYCRHCLYTASKDLDKADECRTRTLYYYSKLNSGKLLVIRIEDSNNILDEDFLDYGIVPLIQFFYSN